MRFLDQARVLSNMRAAVNYLTGAEVSADRLKTTFINVLNTAQSSSIRMLDDDLYLEFDNPSLVDLLVSRGVFSREEVAGGVHLLPEEERARVAYELGEAKTLLNKINSNLYRLIASLIGSVAAYRIPGRDGGSVSCCIGLIWLSPRPDWTIEYYAEMLVHEFVHNSVFLEDMVRGIMPEPDLLERDDALSISAIRQTRRPYDKALHSACVTAAIMYYYHAIGNTEEASRHLIPLRRTISELHRNDGVLSDQGLNLLTGNGREMIQELQQFVDGPQYNMIASALARE